MSASSYMTSVLRRLGEKHAKVQCTLSWSSSIAAEKPAVDADMVASTVRVYDRKIASCYRGQVCSQQG